MISPIFLVTMLDTGRWQLVVPPQQLPRRPADSACGQLPVAISVCDRDFTTLATAPVLHLSG